MSLIQRIQESDEVLAGVITVALTIVLAIIRWIVKPRGHVKWAVTHQYTFLTHPQPQPPPVPFAGAVPAVIPPPQQLLVYTRTIWVENVGRAAVENVEIIFNYPPQHFEIWPQRQFEEVTNAAGNLAITLNGLNPREWATITMLNVGVQLPLITNVRWQGGNAAIATPMAPQQVLPRWLLWLLWGLMLSGVVAWLYAIVRLILFALSWW